MSGKMGQKGNMAKRGNGFNGKAAAAMNKAGAAGNGAQGITREQYLDLYYYMRLNRAVEDQMVKLFRQNK